jgi:hypothetical protein
MNKYNFTLLVSALLLASSSLFAQAPAAFDFPNGCTQATLNGTSFTVEVKLDGMTAENNVDWVAVFNADEEVVGRAVVEEIFSNGSIVSGATLVLRETQGSTSCAAVYTNGPVTMKLFDSSTGDVLLAGNSIFPASNDNGEVNGPDGSGATVDVFDFLSAALPVTLANFSATPNRNKVDLTWSTSSETENSYFEVQRSSTPDGNFQNIGKVLGNETTTEFNTYEYTDINPAEGTNYYRLQQFDLDGTSDFSPIVVADIAVAAERSVAVYPNPTAAGNRMTVRLNGNWTAGGANLQLVDANGRQIANWAGLSNGSLNTELPVVKAGIYQLIATDGKERTTTRVVIR